MTCYDDYCTSHFGGFKCHCKSLCASAQYDKAGITILSAFCHEEGHFTCNDQAHYSYSIDVLSFGHVLIRLIGMQIHRKVIIYLYGHCLETSFLALHGKHCHAGYCEKVKKQDLSASRYFGSQRCQLVLVTF